MISRISAIIIFLLMAFSLNAQMPDGRQQFRDDASQNPDQNQKKARTSKGSIFLNDTVQNIYGPKTTLTTTEEDLFFNRNNYHPIDTSIVNLHRWGYVQRYNYLYQDLGNIGTSLNPIYPVVRNFAGATSGFNSYRLYYDSKEPRYYDTKSPYAKINVIWGGNGRSMTNIEFTRNINSRWNFGFNYRPILVDKQLQRQRKGDRHVIAQYYDFFTTYKSKNEKYYLLFNFRRTRHRVFENGGVKLKATDSEDMYYDKEAAPRMVAAESNQLIKNIHLFGQYALDSAFQLYNTIDFTREDNNFLNDAKKEDLKLNLFDHWERVLSAVDTFKTSDQFKLTTFQDELGIKGRANFLFYSVYYKLRTYSTFYKHDNSRLVVPVDEFNGSPLSQHLNQGGLAQLNKIFDSRGVEHYLGGRIAFDIDSLTRLSGQAELNQLGNYSIDARFSSKWIDATFVQSISRPAFLASQYRGSHDFWNNSFDNIAGLKMEGFLKTPFKKFLVSPGLTYTLFSNYIYYRKMDPLPYGNLGAGQTVLPVQTASLISVANPQVRLGITLFRKIKLSGSVINNLVTRDLEGAMKIPDWLVTSQLALEDFWFKKNLQVQVGFDVTWRSGYKAMGYDPVIQQYYVQNDVTVGQAFIADVFLNARLKTGRLFVKYHNIAQLFTGTGYLVTPGYPGQRNVLDFGFELIMFD